MRGGLAIDLEQRNALIDCEVRLSLITEASDVSTDGPLAFGIFEGGGARGILHVAALRSAEEQGLRFLGVAGSSAGAIIAALTAVGFKADNIFDPLNPVGHILHPGGIPELLGLRDWAAFKSTFALFESCTSDTVPSLEWLRRFILFATRVAMVVTPRWSRLGFFRTAAIQSRLDAVLRMRYNAVVEKAAAGSASAQTIDEGQKLLFRHVGTGAVTGIIPLKVIATDLARNRAVVFSAEETPEVSVAAAVTASLAMPVVFEPVDVPYAEGAVGAIYGDGGVASNFPTWVFEQERLAESRRSNSSIHLVGFSFEDVREFSPRTRHTRRLSKRQLASMLGKALLTAAQGVQESLTVDLIEVKLPCSIGALHFGESWFHYRDGYVAAKMAANEQLFYRLRARPAAISKALAAFGAEATALISSSGDCRLRVAVVEPVRSTSRRSHPLNFRVEQTWNFGEDADDRLVLDSSNGAAPRAFQERGPVLWKRLDTENMVAGLMTKYERALVWKDLRSIISLPVFDSLDPWARAPQERPEPVGVVCIDANIDLAPYFDDDSFLRFMSRRTAALTAVFSSSGPG